MGTAPYDVLALDLDGTLLRPDGSVSRPTIDALARARHAGILVTICTGRGFAECEHVLRAVDQREEVVVAGGSIIACPTRRRTSHRFAMAEQDVRASVDRVLHRGHAALVLKDPLEAGYDYAVVTAGRHALDPVTSWWFQSMGISHRLLDSLDHDPHPAHTVRVGACAPARHLADIEHHIRADLGDRASLHNFPAVVAPHLHPSDDPLDRVHVLEVFDSRASKWSALRVLARRAGHDSPRVAAIGDQVNDLDMIRHAHLGVAMGNAVEPVRNAATRLAPPNTEDGVAHAIDHILAGRW